MPIYKRQAAADPPQRGRAANSGTGPGHDGDFSNEGKHLEFLFLALMTKT